MKLKVSLGILKKREMPYSFWIWKHNGYMALSTKIPDRRCALVVACIRLGFPRSW